MNALKSRFKANRTIPSTSSRSYQVSSCAIVITDFPRETSAGISIYAFLIVEFSIFSHFRSLTSKYSPLSHKIFSIYVLPLRQGTGMRCSYISILSKYIESVNTGITLLTLRDEPQQHQSWQSVAGCLRATF
jgi:hypothetical protein